MHIAIESAALVVDRHGMSNHHHKSLVYLRPPSNLPPAPPCIPPGRPKTTGGLIFMIFISLGPRRAKCKIIVRDGPWFKNGIFKIMLPTRAGSTFSIFNTFHVDASVLNSCFVANTGLSVRVLIATRAFLNSYSRS